MFVKNASMIGALIFATLLIAGSCGKMEDDYLTLIEKGEFTKAESKINKMLTDENLSDNEKSNLRFEIERMNRISKDFTKTKDDVFEYIKQYIPDVTDDDLKRWEDEKSLECMTIDGEKLYFKWGHRNLFRINKENKKIWDEQTNPEGKVDSTDSKLVFNKHNLEVMNAVQKSGEKYVKPVRLKVKYSISVPADSVPDGEMVRCWIPFPREISGRQTDLKIINTEPQKYALAPNDSTLQRTIYFEKPAKAGEKTEFFVEYLKTTYGAYFDINPEKVVPVDPNSELAPYLAEVEPHIIFTDKLRELSAQIIGDETNPYIKAQKLFEWVDNNTPWASAREYSTIRNISDYATVNHHGDCGIQTLQFVTLCRMNGIPARWQSGWVFEPAGDNMHDWGMIYFEPYGWMPMDVTYGLLDTNNEKLKWFYLSGMDSYRNVYNDDISDNFFPAKKHFRSETVDSQRGEVEWSDGNLYFDQWDWDIEWEVVWE
jgi:hypothetical protein